MGVLYLKRHKIRFHLLLIGATIFYVALGTVLLIFYLDSFRKGDIRPKDKFIPVAVLILYGAGIYTIYRYFKNVPSIVVDRNYISFNNERFVWSDLQRIALTGKAPFPYVFTFPMEAATLVFKNGKTKYIFDEFYEDAWLVKLFLKQVIVDKGDYTAPQEEEVSDSRFENDFFDTFKNSQFTSMRGIALWTLLSVFAYLLATSIRKPAYALIVSVAFIAFCWFIILSWQMHYFQVSPNFFVVRNNNLFWRVKVYRLSEIREIVFETQGKMPNCLRVITTDFRTKLYPAGTLKNETWLALKDSLERYDIKVRNECI